MSKSKNHQAKHYTPDIREPESNSTVPESEVMISIQRSLDGKWAVTMGERKDGREEVMTKGWGSRQGALAELARLIPRLQSFLTRSPKKAVTVPGVEARS